MKVLIVKTSSLGDIIHCFPVISFLKKKFSHATIDWVVEKPFASLLESHPHVNAVHVIDTKKWRKKPLSLATRQEFRSFRQNLPEYDVIFDFQGNTKSALFTWLAKSAVKVGFSKPPEWLNRLATTHRYDPPLKQNIRDDYLYLTRSYFQDFTTDASSQVILKSQDQPLNEDNPIFMVCPGSAWPNKQLHPIALSRFLKQVQEKTDCTYLFIWGSEKEKALAEELHQDFGGVISDKLPLPDLQSLMRHVDRVIAMDSLPLHLAGTTDTPTFSVFGPSLALKYAPIGSQHKTIQGSCPYSRTFEKRCPVLRSCPTGACIREIDGDTLFQEFTLSL